MVSGECEIEVDSAKAKPCLPSERHTILYSEVDALAHCKALSNHTWTGKWKDPEFGPRKHDEQALGDIFGVKRFEDYRVTPAELIKLAVKQSSFKKGYLNRNNVDWEFCSEFVKANKKVEFSDDDIEQHSTMTPR